MTAELLDVNKSELSWQKAVTSLHTVNRIKQYKNLYEAKVGQLVFAETGPENTTIRAVL